MTGFESWMRLNYPNLVKEWEVEASSYLTLREWLDQLHWLVPSNQEQKIIKKGGKNGTTQTDLPLAKASRT